MHLVVKRDFASRMRTIDRLVVGKVPEVSILEMPPQSPSTVELLQTTIHSSVCRPKAENALRRSTFERERYQIGNGNCDTGKACDRLKSVENGHEVIKDGHFHSTSIRLPLADRNLDRRVVFLVNDIILQRTPTTSPTYCPGSQPPLLILHLSAPRLQSAYLALLFNDQLVPSRHTSRQIHLVPHQSSRPPSR